MSLPVTSEEIAEGLRAVGVGAGDTVLAHTSLSSISDAMVVGGAIGVIEALFDALTETGTLVMPAFSADYSDPASWTNPPVSTAWWPIIRESMPAWRADRARTFGIGVVAETFRSVRGVLRTGHPQSSFCAWGAHAAAVTAAHPLDDPLGALGPLGRLRALGAKVALIGCGFGSCTAFHLAEHETTRPPPRVSHAAPIEADGERVWVRWSQPAYDASRFATIGDAFASTPACENGRIGLATCHAFALADGVEHATRWLDAH